MGRGEDVSLGQEAAPTDGVSVSVVLQPHVPGPGVRGADLAPEDVIWPGLLLGLRPGLPASAVRVRVGRLECAGVLWICKLLHTYHIFLLLLFKIIRWFLRVEILILIIVALPLTAWLPRISLNWNLFLSFESPSTSPKGWTMFTEIWLLSLSIWNDASVPFPGWEIRISKLLSSFPSNPPISLRILLISFSFDRTLRIDWVSE